MQQQDWCEQQIKEKADKKAAEKAASEAYDEMALSHYSQLKDAQTEHASQRRQNAVDTKNINVILAQEKKERDTIASHLDKKREAIEVEYTTSHDFMTENKATEVSMLAPHRVKPYHFKGMTDAQKAAIMHERSI